MFAEQVVRTPDGIAVLSEAGYLSYRELDARAAILAGELTVRGVVKGSVVIVKIERSFDLVIALLGVLKVGAAYLPVDPGTPAARLEQLVADTAPACMLTSALGTVRVTPHGDAGSALADAVYLMYTSGSTGQPKGVIVSQAAVVHHLRWVQDAYPLGPDDRVLQKTPASFDVSVYELFWPLVNGATLVLTKPGGHREPEYLAELIERFAVTTVQFVPSMLRAFLSEETAASCASLRRVLCIGEALPVGVRDRYHELLAAQLHNLYGPTEATIAITAWPCQPDADRDTVPIGRPIRNCQVYVLDARLRPLPPGELGEIYLGGVQLAEGYVARPGLTAERFVASPFGPPGARVYRTGDFGRIRYDGVIEYAGRADGQVKIRGHRVELGEIEAVLSAHPAVMQAAVLACQAPGGGIRLAGFVVSRAWDVDELERYLRERLPDYMVPTTWIPMTELPLTSNGKLDRSALVPPDFEAAAGPSALPGQSVSGEHEPSAKVSAQLLAGLVAEVLAISAPSIDRSFIALGGDSITAMQVVRLARRVGIGLETKDVLEQPSVAALAEHARSVAVAGQPSRPTTDSQPLSRSEIEEIESELQPL
ncbi:MAG TPA: amino acid adenylation domain-containing protein [Jatrophihabitans sp.]